MENKVKKAKVDYAAIIREFEMYGRGRSLRQFCDERIIHMLMCYITIESVFGTARQRVVIHPKATILLFPWKLNLLREKLQPLHR